MRMAAQLRTDGARPISMRLCHAGRTADTGRRTARGMYAFYRRPPDPEPEGAGKGTGEAGAWAKVRGGVW
nr:MAG TPA: hypothetical protein [Caudoviricetes sp.]